MSIGAQKNSLMPQNNWNATFGAVDKFGYLVKANVRLIDFNVGDVTVSCEGSATVSGSDFRNIKVGGEVRAQFKYNF
ncbi:hypothetical protein [Akkermansia sp.]|uniref:hypothetical protein n=1 Tax=Akkermansia sp. TaxID=1872421 RepID=UPI0025C31447|nr:hypothetical protein [Akkermansia sp.]MCC8148960.1 hypothetical protein [Akkermansia sp.]